MRRRAASRLIPENIVLVGDATELHGGWPDFEFRGEKYRGLKGRRDSFLDYTFSLDAAIGMNRQLSNFPLHRLVYGQVQAELDQALKGLREALSIPNRRDFV